MRLDFIYSLREIISYAKKQEVQIDSDYEIKIFT